MGIGGGPARGADDGTGGGKVGGVSVTGDWRVLSSRLESRACAFRASLWCTEEAISVS